ncbi:MAG: PepSY-associated TM helix domain-containing protein [Myxococcota bacterium]
MKDETESRTGGRRALYFAHRLTGLVFGFLGIVVFFTGVVALFADDLNGWAHRSDHYTALADLEPGALEAAHHAAEAVVSESVRSSFSVRHAEGQGLDFVFQPEDGNGNFERVFVDPSTATVLNHRTGPREEIFQSEGKGSLSRFFVQLHVRMLVPGEAGLWLTGLVGFGLLFLAGSGIIVHWPRRRNLLQRPRRALRRWTGDLHTLIGAWTLPYTVILALTGAFFSFAGALLIPILVLVNYAGDRVAMQEAIGGEVAVPPAEGTANLDGLLASARTREPELRVNRIQFKDWDGPNAHALLNVGEEGYILTNKTLAFSGHTGEFLEERPILGVAPSAGSSLVMLIAGLHFGNLASTFTKVLWALLGLLACLLGTTGIALWYLRNERRAPRGARLTKALLGATAALPLGVGSATVAWALTVSAESELWMAIAFFGSVLFGAALTLRTSALRAVQINTVFGALSCLLVPVLGASATGIGLLEAAADPARAPTIGVDIGFICTAFLLLAAAYPVRGLASAPATEDPSSP